MEFAREGVHVHPSSLLFASISILFIIRGFRHDP